MRNQNLIDQNLIHSTSNHQMLTVQDLNVYYGTIHALHDVSFEVTEGEIVTLIGANGAGKTTILHSLSGLIPSKAENISFMGQTLKGVSANKIVEKGLAQVPEGRRIFANLTVMENLEMGAYTRRDKHNVKHDYEQVFTSFPRLKERIHQVAGTLSGGEQQMLAIGRTLMSRPKLMLMDEPSMGLAPLLVKEIFSIIKDINKTGTTILLVEQNANMALSIANRAYVLETGKIVLHGDAKIVAASEQVRKAYLGG
jgi:branched-chain amino acid transport system ATP-binding protein